MAPRIAVPLVILGAAARRQRDAEDGVELEMRRGKAHKLIAAGAAAAI